MIRFALILLMSLAVSSQALAAVKWNNSKSNSPTDLSEFSVKPFKAKMGKPNVSKNSVEGCGKPKNTYTFQFKGSKESAICQIGNSQEYKTGDTPISWPEYNFFGISKTKCADAITERPKDLYVTPASDKVGWCPYSNPEVKRFPLKKENGFIEMLLAGIEGNGIRVTKQLINGIDKDIPYRKGFTGLLPPEARGYLDEEYEIRQKVIDKNAIIFSAYLIADEEEQKNIAERTLNLLNFLAKKNAFEHLFYAPITLAGRKKADGSYETFADYSEPDGYDMSNNFLIKILSGIINLYGITKRHHEENELNHIKNYVEKLVWLTEQGIGSVHYIPNITGTPDQPNHHTAPLATIWLLWGITSSDEFYYEAGLNHYLSILQMSRSDGSIESEVKKSPRAKSTHGGWGSLLRNNETLSHQVLAAILLKSQGHPVEKIDIDGVSISNLVKFGIDASVDTSIADRHTGTKTYDLKHITKPGSDLVSNLGWYKLARKFLSVEENSEALQLISENKKHDRIKDIGIMSVDKLFYSAVKEKDGKLFIGVDPEKKSVWNF